MTMFARVREAVGLLGLSLPIVVLTILIAAVAPVAVPLLAWYAIAFVAVVARWGWGRSFALGVTGFGISLVWMLVRGGLGGQPIVAQLAVAHALALVGLVRYERPRVIPFTLGWLVPSVLVWAIFFR